jgi:hypothetical protein
MTSLLSYLIICAFNYIIVAELLFKIAQNLLLVANKKYIILDDFILKIIAYSFVLPIIVIVLYYTLLFIPGRSDLFYLLIIMSIPIGLYIISRINKNYKVSNESTLFTSRNASLVFIFFIIIQFFYLNFKGITENDYLEYGILGNHFFDSKSIEYVKDRFLQENYFYYVGLHGFTFPLTKTFENLTNTILNANADLYFKSISGVYSILIGLLFFRIANIFLDKKLALLVLLLLIFNYGFFIISLRYHIDTFRLFYFLISAIFLIEAINIFDTRIAITSGFILGAHAFAHSLAVFIAAIWILSLAFNCFFKKSYAIKQLVILVIFFLLLGGMHYILDVSIGTGWIFQDLDFY